MRKFSTEAISVTNVAVSQLEDHVTIYSCNKIALEKMNDRIVSYDLPCEAGQEPCVLDIRWVRTSKPRRQSHMRDAPIRPEHFPQQTMTPLQPPPPPPSTRGALNQTQQRAATRRSKIDSGMPPLHERAAFVSANQVGFPADPLSDFRMWESCLVMPLVGGFCRGSAVFSRHFIPALLHSPRFVFIGSQDLDIKSRQSLFTHSLRRDSIDQKPWVELGENKAEFGRNVLGRVVAQPASSRARWRHALGASSGPELVRGVFKKGGGVPGGGAERCQRFPLLFTVKIFVNRARFEARPIRQPSRDIASQKQSSDTHKIYDRVKRCRERKINIKASERVNPIPVSSPADREPFRSVQWPIIYKARSQRPVQSIEYRVCRYQRKPPRRIFSVSLPALCPWIARNPNTRSWKVMAVRDKIEGKVPDYGLFTSCRDFILKNKSGSRSDPWIAQKKFWSPLNDDIAISVESTTTSAASMDETRRRRRRSRLRDLISRPRIGRVSEVMRKVFRIGLLSVSTARAPGVRSRSLAYRVANSSQRKSPHRYKNSQFCDPSPFQFRRDVHLYTKLEMLLVIARDYSANSSTTCRVDTSFLSENLALVQSSVLVGHVSVGRNAAEGPQDVKQDWRVLPR
ncbi:hypothetical protein PR048_027110 [Dryococelus australis]|uniref:Uncharacterized protein n=1 Tax=Dryococelus australis TaxID=614101 RepID=A0ABQ9GGK0_9NEOP|nr:hypothetical protein PR048_027110 [Dryococelus australis]